MDGAGATAVVATITETDILIAWAGDSEAVLFRKDGSMQELSEPHKPWSPVCLQGNPIENFETQRDKNK